MLSTVTARYIKIPSGYMGQLLEWPEVITEGEDLESCRESLKDAVEQMVIAYRELNKNIPFGNALFEILPLEMV
jgi:predicted RNase H-like HicB family nuclease